MSVFMWMSYLVMFVVYIVWWCLFTVAGVPGIDCPADIVSSVSGIVWPYYLRDHICGDVCRWRIVWSANVWVCVVIRLRERVVTGVLWLQCSTGAALSCTLCKTCSLAVSIRCLSLPRMRQARVHTVSPATHSPYLKSVRLFLFDNVMR